MGMCCRGDKGIDLWKLRSEPETASKPMRMTNYGGVVEMGELGSEALTAGLEYQIFK